MENQHRKITGYRDLTQGEIDLMNEVKAKGIELDALLKKIGLIDIGSPPLVRGLPREELSLTCSLRITPACAGTTCSELPKTIA